MSKWDIWKSWAFSDAGVVRVYSIDKVHMFIDVHQKLMIKYYNAKNLGR